MSGGQIIKARLKALRSPTSERLALVLAVALGFSWIALAVILRETGLEIAVTDFLPYVGIALLMAGVSVYSVVRLENPHLASGAALVALGTLALLSCGLVANAGLRLGFPVADASLAAIDARFGISAAAISEFVAQQHLLGALLAFAYNWSGPVAALCVVAALIAKNPGRSWEIAGTLVLAMQVVAVLSIFAPAKGAAFHFDLMHLQGTAIPHGAAIYAGEAFDHFYSGTQTVIRLADMNGTVTFPSFHTVLGLVVLQAVAQTRWVWLGACWSALVVLSTVPMGGHYVIDVAAGGLLWLACMCVVQWCWRDRQATDRTRVQPVAQP